MKFKSEGEQNCCLQQQLAASVEAALSVPLPATLAMKKS